MKIFGTIFLLLITYHSSAENSAPAPQVIYPKLIDFPNVTKEVNVSRGGLEGWAHVSFIVDLNGVPKDLVVFDYSGKERYIKATKRYIKKLRYAPASIDGIPSLSHETFFLRHQFSGVGFSGNSVSPRFLEEYQKVMDTLLESDADLDEIEIRIYDLKDDHSKNLNEQVLVAWLESLYFYKKRDFLEHLRQARIISRLHNYVPVKIFSKAIVNLYESELFYGYYLEAKQTVHNMSSIEGLKLNDDLKTELFDRIKTTIVAKEPALVTKGKIWSLGAWVAGVFKRNISIVNVEGKIDSLELRCTGHHSKHTEGWDKGIFIPTHARSCSVLVLGEASTSFDLIQSEAEFVL